MNLPNPAVPEVTLEQDSVLHRITNRIRRSLKLQEILAATVVEVRSLLGTDRVKIYQFHADGSGQVVAESIHEDRLPSLFGLNFPAGDIPKEARELFVQSRVRSVIDVDAGAIGYSHFQEQVDGTIDAEDIRFRALDPCHMEYMTAMGVKSSVVVPICHQDTLWGLLVSHHSETRTIPDQELQLLQSVVDQLSVAIAQAELLVQAQEKAQREATLNRINGFLHAQTTIDLQSALQEAVAAFGGSGGRLCVKAKGCYSTASTLRSFLDCLQTSQVELYTCGTQPEVPSLAAYPLIEQYSVWQVHYENVPYETWAISDLYQIDALRNLQPAFYNTQIRSLLMIPLEYRQLLLGYLIIFRDETETETLWAGRVENDQRQIYPQISFEMWRDTKRKQDPNWSTSELELAQALSKQFSTAIYQSEMRQQLQTLNASLESQVEQRTIELQDVVEQQRVLFEVATKMRRSLNLEDIFATTVKEVRTALDADRVCVYRFDSHSDSINGCIVAEDVLPPFVAAIALNIQDNCFQEKYEQLHQQGKVFVAADIYKAGLTECHVNMLKQLQVRANFVVPISTYDRLWGLLCIHQCNQPRDWRPLEIQFVTQLAVQLGVALEQSNLLTQRQRQTEQLSQAIQDLQNAQTQLIQTEKMSSLGQLVAGVAHEINNPVNFIYGNLSHVSEYVTQLLSALDLYQQAVVLEPTIPGEACSTIAQQIEKLDVSFLQEDLPKILDSMQMGTERILQIVRSLQNFSRLDQAEMKPVDIHQGIDSTLLILRHRLKAKPALPEIAVIRNFGDLPLVECYPAQLNQVFMNIISNAIDAIEEHFKEPNGETPTITIHTEIVQDFAVVRISDNGSGIPEAVRCQLFDPFFTTKPIGKGTGLGLSISYQIVTEKHKGQLICHSQPNQGTEFRIEIPLHQAIG